MKLVQEYESSSPNRDPWIFKNYTPVQMMLPCKAKQPDTWTFSKNEVTTKTLISCNQSINYYVFLFLTGKGNICSCT